MNCLKVKTRFSKTKSFLILLCIWVIGIIISLPFLWMVEYTPNQCYLNMTTNDLAYFFSFNLFLIVFPTIALVIMYLMIIFKLKRRKTSFSKILNSNDRQSINQLNDKIDLDLFELRPLKSRSLFTLSQKCDSRKIESELKSTITISILSVIFYCFQLPARLILCWSYLYDTFGIKYENIESRSSKSLNLFDISLHIVIVIYYLHCVSNPIIYNVLSSKFRESFLKFKK